MTHDRPPPREPRTIADTRGTTELPIWVLAVLEPADSGPVALVGIEPVGETLYGQLHSRMRRAGFGQLNTRAWNTATWALSPTAAIDVVRGDLVRITTGQSSVYTAGPMPVSDRWLQAARARRALIALIKPGTVAGVDDDDTKIARLGDLAATRQLLGAMAPVRFDLPVTRPAVTS